MTAIQHIAFNCKDLLKQEAFYTKHFGFKRARVLAKGTPQEFIMLRLGSCCMELFPPAENAAGSSGGEQPAGFKHIAFEVDSLDATIAGLNADGIQTEDIIDCSGTVEGLRVCFFTDPEGNRVELVQGWKDEKCD